MKRVNNIPAIDTEVTIYTKVEDKPMLALLYRLVPDKYIFDSVDEAKERLVEGVLYIEFSDGKLCSSSKFNELQIDRGCFEGESPIVAYKSILIDNLAFAILLQYAFGFTPEK